MVDMTSQTGGGAQPIRPLSTAPNVSIRLPGSKSFTNRALLCAALAPGVSRLTGVLLADDSRAMLDAVAAIGAEVTLDESAFAVTITGTDPTSRTQPPQVNARQSGTTSRFILPALALSPAGGVLDGSTQLRARPFGPLTDALRQLGVRTDDHGVAGYLPLKVTGPASGGRVRMPGHLSSQFLSGLLMAGPLMPRGLQVELTSPLVSAPYIAMTASVMGAFGVATDGLTVGPAAYQPTEYAIEPDASAASYFLGAAAVTGGRISVEGLGRASVQGDVAFADVLQQMGAAVEQTANRTTVTGPHQLHGIDVDMTDISDTAQTLAAVAVFADSPTRVRGIGFIRRKETDRIAAMVTELRRAGISATEDDDGFTIRPGSPKPTTFETYDDHRMAMSLSLLGLRAPGMAIQDPGCVGKTYPEFFTDLGRLESGR
jgi:3-phosphoshikimate 1-carboxyvinyltransferase